MGFITYIKSWQRKMLSYNEQRTKCLEKKEYQDARVFMYLENQAREFEVQLKLLHAAYGDETLNDKWKKENQEQNKMEKDTYILTFAEILKIKQDMKEDLRGLHAHLIDKLEDIEEASKGHGRVFKCGKDFHVYVHTLDMAKIAVGEEKGKKFIKLYYE